MGARCVSSIYSMLCTYTNVCVFNSMFSIRIEAKRVVIFSLSVPGECVSIRIYTYLYIVIVAVAVVVELLI